MLNACRQIGRDGRLALASCIYFKMDTDPKRTSDDTSLSLAHLSETITSFAGIVRLPDPDNAEELARKLRVERQGGERGTVRDEHMG